MTHKTRSLCLAFVAVAAMSMAAAAAQASELHVTTQAQTAAITGEQTPGTNFVFQINPPGGPKTICDQLLFEGDVTRPGAGTQITAQELTLTPTFTGCKSFGVTATVRLNGCKYTITNKLNNVTTALKATVDITGCTTIPNQQNHLPIEVQTGGCQITVPQQHNLSDIGFQNQGIPGQNTEDVHVNFTISGLTYQLHGMLCGHPVTVTTHNGTLHGVATLKAFQHLGTEVKTHEGHEYQKIIIGAQLGLVAT
jgi:hypothetical protein